MISNTLIFPAKKIRARIIADHVRAARYRGVVVFGCGNGAAALRDEGLYVVDVSPRGAISPNKWWTPTEIHECWPDLFDATSGHLPLWMMLDIGRAFRAHLGDLAGPLNIPTGSGETILCLQFSYSETEFIPVRNLDEATRYDPQAPLNPLVSFWADNQLRRSTNG
jgi:hypothetical protein